MRNLFFFVAREHSSPYLKRAIFEERKWKTTGIDESVVYGLYGNLSCKRTVQDAESSLLNLLCTALKGYGIPGCGLGAS